VAPVHTEVAAATKTNVSRTDGFKFVRGLWISTSKIQTLFLSHFRGRRQNCVCREMKRHNGATRGTTARKSYKFLILPIGNISRIWWCSVKSGKTTS
jgi:hypothetical protein